MQVRDGRLTFAPTDLVNYLGCAHAAVLDRRQLSEPHVPRTFSDTDQLLAKKGIEHEIAYLGLLKAEGKIVAEVPRGGPLDERVAETDAAVRGGVDVVYQAALTGERWGGLADFLIRVGDRTDPGKNLYEAVDTKLARRPEPKHVVQLVVYSDLLAARQGTPPRQTHLVLGDGTRASFRVDDFSSYVRHARRRLELFLDDPPADSRPEPCAHCAHCHWLERCEQQWEDEDHLSLVANVRRSQQDKLERAGVSTLAALAGANPATRVPGLNAAVFERLRAQAALQLHKRTTGENRYEVVACDPGRGFSRMPEPDPGDLFFDIEGDPLHPDGLEYLFGVCHRGTGGLAFRAFWAHDHAEERCTFGAFMAFLHEHLAAHPNAFVYHYNHYEPTALKRLAARYAVAEHQLDDLLRRRKFVDLYQVVREAVRVSEPSYSLKNLETFYMAKRLGGVATAGDSIVVYNRWRDCRDGKLLDEIAAYNEVDCRSTAGLRDWLLELRPAETTWFAPGTGAKAPPDPDKEKARKDREDRYAEVQKRLQDAAGGETDYRWRLADLLGFHDREAKPQWWEFFARRDRLDDELVDDAECLAGLELARPPEKVKQSFRYTYTFPPQETKRKAGETVHDVATLLRAGEIEALDEKAGRVSIKLGTRSPPPPSRMSVGPSGPIDTRVLNAALYRVAQDALDGTERYPAVRDLLAKAAPRIRGRKPGEPVVAGGDLLDATVEALEGLDHSFLFIQGPPGAGKTHTSAHAIVELIRRGKKVGVAAGSHKAIHNLLAKVEELATRLKVKFEGVKKSSGDESEFAGKYVQSVSDKKDVSLDAELLAGTAWLFADEKFDQALDYLIIDEAGQVSVANVAAMGTSARNLVLVGDQMQLGQPIQGVHPGESGLSVLDFLLGGRATVAPDRGIFLDRTRRLRPEVCEFVSDSFYDGRLRPAAETAGREVVFAEAIPGISRQGIHFHPVRHAGCSQRSEEEGLVVRDYCDRLLKQRFRDADGKVRAVTPGDVLVVSPYNVQVNHLRSVLGDDFRVGTVDKFQGQEAAVVLVSMATSSAEYLPRDVEFFFSANRLNVAVSRAQCLAIVVANPALMETPCRTVEHLRLVNTFCRLLEFDLRLQQPVAARSDADADPTGGATASALAALDESEDNLEKDESVSERQSLLNRAAKRASPAN